MHFLLHLRHFTFNRSTFENPIISLTVIEMVSAVVFGMRDALTCYLMHSMLLRLWNTVTLSYNAHSIPINHSIWRRTDMWRQFSLLGTVHHLLPNMNEGRNAISVYTKYLVHFSTKILFNQFRKKIRKISWNYDL
jgi:hypothetical protein